MFFISHPEVLQNVYSSLASKRVKVIHNNQEQEDQKANIKVSALNTIFTIKYSNDDVFMIFLSHQFGV